MTAAAYVPRVDAIQYTGSNASEVANWATNLGEQYGQQLGWTRHGAEQDGPYILVTLDENTDIISISLVHLASPITVTPDQYLIFQAGNFTVEASDLFQINQAPLVKEPIVSAVGIADVPAIAVIATPLTVPVVVELSREFVDAASYRVDVKLVGGRSMLTVNPATVVKVDGNTVRVPVTATLAYVSGAQVHVTAHGIAAAV